MVYYVCMLYISVGNRVYYMYECVVPFRVRNRVAPPWPSVWGRTWPWLFVTWCSMDWWRSDLYPPHTPTLTPPLTHTGVYHMHVYHCVINTSTINGGQICNKVHVLISPSTLKSPITSVFIAIVIRISICSRYWLLHSLSYWTFM